MTPAAKRVMLIAAAFLAGLAAVFAVMLLVLDRTQVPIPQPSAVGGPFRLVDQDGRTVTDADMKGEPFLVFFGFTHCPDVCPTTLFEVSEVLSKLGADADRVGALFVTVDPERDTPDKLKDYLSSFDPHLKALTGSPEEIAAAVRAYRAYAKKVPLDQGGYTMDHTALIYLMDKEGRFVAPFKVKRPPEEAAAELRRYL